MENTVFSFELTGAAQDVQEPFHLEGGLNKGKCNYLFETEQWDDDYFCSEYGLQQEKGVQPSKIQKQVPNSEFEMSEEVPYDTVSPLSQPPHEAMNIESVYNELLSQPPHEAMNIESVYNELSNLVDVKKEKPSPISLSSLELLKTYNNGVRRMNKEQANQLLLQGDATGLCNNRILSTEEVMRVAGARFIQFFVHTEDDLSMLKHPFGYGLSGLSDEESQDVELAHLLLASAERVGNQQFDRASRMLNQCECLMSRTGNPVQRVIFYFAEALRERIDRETGQIPWTSFGGNRRHAREQEEAMKSLSPAVLECHRLLPFSQVLQFAGIQAIIESVGSAKKVHLIDLGIRSGLPWTILMQAFAARHGCRLEHFKITAIGMISQHLEEIGKRLVSFAENLNLPFTFKALIVSEMKDLKTESFNLEEDEAIAVYAHLALRNMLHQPECLEALMRVIKNLKPCLMVVSEVEANHNSPVLMNRFIEALFYYSTFFDSLDVCMGRNNHYRIIIEAEHLGSGIQNIVATEGEERTVRNVGIDVWRAFFKRFGLLETELSQSSLYQADLIVKKFSYGNFCTMDMNGKSLLVGWKGTPLHSLSVWKFT